MNTIPLFYSAPAYCCVESMYITVAVIDLTESFKENNKQEVDHIPSGTPYNHVHTCHLKYPLYKWSQLTK